MSKVSLQTQFSHSTNLLVQSKWHPSPETARHSMPTETQEIMALLQSAHIQQKQQQ